MTVRTEISDLFFNTDMNDVWDNVACEFNEDELRAIADDFLMSLERLGVEVPSASELVRDFLRRL